METLPLFQEVDELKAAIRADVESAGGFKDVAVLLWPKANPITGQQKLSNACNPKQKQELDYHEIQIVKQAARAAVGASHVHALESKRLACDLHWVTQHERAERVAVKLNDAVQSLQATLSEAQDLLRGLK